MSAKVVVVGAGGFVGARLIEKLAKQTEITVPPQSQDAQPKVFQLRKLVLLDLRIGDDLKDLCGQVKDKEMTWVEGDLTDEVLLTKQFNEDGCDHLTVIQLAACLSGNAEDNFELGMQVNLHANMKMLEILRLTTQRTGVQPVFVFSSTDYVLCYNKQNIETPPNEEAFRLSPVSYGVQKACTELLCCDYARRNFVDARVLRLSCVIVKPGLFNVLSYPWHGVVSQPLKGLTYNCPLEGSAVLPCSFVGGVVQGLLDLAQRVPAASLGHNRVVQVPAKTVSLAELWQATQEVAAEQGLALGHVVWAAQGAEVALKLTPRVNPAVDCSRALELGVGGGMYDLKGVVKDYVTYYHAK